MSQKRILIDLTDIAQWSGHHGGTQRVVYGIAKNYFLDSSANVLFFTYSSVRNEFFETDFKDILDRVENTASNDPQTVPGASRKQRIKTLLMPYVPKSVLRNEPLKKSIKDFVRTGIYTARTVKAKAEHVYSRAVSTVNDHESNRPIIFNKNDVVLILGKPWDEPKLQTLLDVRKSEVGFKVVELVYDLIISLYPHLHHPTLFKKYTEQMFKAGQGSDMLLAISESSKNDFIKLSSKLKITPPPIHVIRLGDEVDAKLTNEEINAVDLSTYGVDKDFLLCVGTIENRKNHALLYYTYKLAAERGLELPQLVIVGGRGWLSDDIQYLIKTDPDMKGRIKIVENVNDSLLATLYTKSLFTVYPSFYEGWGLPVAEAMAYGKVCVASNYSSIPEIAGDLGRYFSPYSTDECLDAIREMLDPQKRTALEEKIAKRYKTTSWSKTYAQVAAYVDQI